METLATASEAAGKSSEWLKSFQNKHGRPPRVLLIGNIANNGYLNAKMLRKAGVDCDVLCHDYYHIMGCPEWEDAAFEGEIRDQNFPDWFSLRIRGFQRPDWFAQGPLRSSARYLIARRCGGKLRTRLCGLWNLCLRLLITQSLLKAARKCLRPLKRCLEAGIHRLRLLRRRAAGWSRASESGFYFVLLLLTAILFALAVAKASPAALAIGAGLLALGAASFLAKKILGSYLRRPETVRGISPEQFEENARSLLRFYESSFPEREDRLTLEEIEDYRPLAPMLSTLFHFYDAVIGSATFGILPLLCGKRPVFAYEHGTIRNIPFEKTAQGRLCALTYRMADRSFITNCDNIEAAKRLGLDNYQFVPHPVNEEHILERDPGLRKELRNRLQSDFIIFHPARQHWEERRHPDWEKGNDILIRGFALFVQKANPRAGAVFVEWGEKVGASKDLLAELGVGDRVLWIPPQPNRRMIQYLGAADLLADQFYLGAFGSITPKGLLHGVPVMLYLDEERHRWCFPQLPPILNARTPEEVFEGLKRIYGDAEHKNRLVEEGKAWYRKYHSNEVIVRIFSEAIAETLEKT